MSGRKTQAQTYIDLIDKRIKTWLSVLGIDTKAIQGIPGGISKMDAIRAFEDVSFITKNDHRGGGLGDLPNSRPAYDLDCDLVPRADDVRSIGSWEKQWKRLYTHRIDLKGDSNWLKLDVDYFYTNIAFKTYGETKLLHGYGNHRARDIDGKILYPNTGSIKIQRPLPYSEDMPATGIKTWRVNPWYSRIDIDNESGIGSRRNCTAIASPTNPCVEAEIVDTGNQESIYVLFRNFLNYPVVVGVSVSY